MEEQNILTKILESVGSLQDEVGSLKETVEFIKDNAVSKDEFQNEISRLDSKMDKGFADVRNEMDKGFADVRNEMDKGFADVRNVIHEIEDRLLTHIDGFVVLNQKLDIELTSLRSKYNRLEGFMQKVATHLHLEMQ